MAEAANHYPRTPSTGDSPVLVRSTQSNRNAAARGVLSSPWTHVRGSEALSSSTASPSSPLASSATAIQGQSSSRRSSSNSSPSKEATEDSYSSVFLLPDDVEAESHSESYDNAGTESNNAGKKVVWNKASNEAFKIGAVMGAVSWPALSESTRASPKLSSSDSLKTLSEGSVPGIASSSQKQVITNDGNPSLGPNNVAPTCQKSMKRVSGSSNVAANGGFHEPVAPPGPVAEIHSARSSVPETYSRDHMQRGSGQRGGFGSQFRNGNDHSQQWNSYRRGNGTPHPQSDGSYHQNHGGRDRVNRDRNSHRSFNGRDVHMQPQRVLPSGFVPHPLHTATPFLPPPPMPVGPFGNPMIYAEGPPRMFYVPVPVPPPTPDSLRGVPVATPIPHPALFFPASDSLLHAKIVAQINYYFSNENLISDTFLRQNMNEDGWVPIELIAGFKKVMLLTNNIPLILDALRTSDVVEVKNGKVRKRDDWRRWIMPPSFEFHTMSSPRSVQQRSSHTTHDTLKTNFQSMFLVEKTNKETLPESFLGKSSSRDLNSPLQLSIAEGTNQAPVQAGS